MIDLSNLKPAPKSRKNRKRVGRGPGSGSGKTAARGVKGQKSRSGGYIPRGFEGGQMPLVRRLPKRGFINIFRTRVAIVNVGQIAEQFGEGAVVDEAALRDARLVQGRYEVIKLLGDGEIQHGLTIKVHRASSAATTKIEAAGGKVEVIGG